MPRRSNGGTARPQHRFSADRSRSRGAARCAAMPSFRRFHGVNLVAQYTRAASGDEAVTKSGDPGPEKNIAARMGWRLRRARGRPIGAMANAHLKAGLAALHHAWARLDLHWRAMAARDARRRDRKSTRLNSSHPSISYAVFCLKKKNQQLARIVNTNQHTNKDL